MDGENLRQTKPQQVRSNLASVVHSCPVPDLWDPRDALESSRCKTDQRSLHFDCGVPKFRRLAMVVLAFTLLSLYCGKHTNLCRNHTCNIPYLYQSTEYVHAMSKLDLTPGT